MRLSHVNTFIALFFSIVHLEGVVVSCRLLVGPENGDISHLFLLRWLTFMHTYRQLSEHVESLRACANFTY